MLRKFASPAAFTFSLVAPLGALAPLAALAQESAPQPPRGYYGPGPWHMGMWGGSGWHGFWMFPLTLLFLVLVCAALFLIVRRPQGPRHWAGPAQRPWSDPTRSALQILNERFARGEIQKEEYAEKKAALLSGS